MIARPGHRPVVDQYVSVGEAAEYLGVSRTTLRSWADRGLIPCAVTFGGHRRFRQQDLDLVERRVSPVGAEPGYRKTIPQVRPASI